MVHSDSRARVDQVVLAERSRVRRDSAADGGNTSSSPAFTPGPADPGSRGREAANSKRVGAQR